MASWNDYCSALAGRMGCESAKGRIQEAILMLQPMLFPDNLPRPRWVTPPWTAASAPWLDLDRALSADDRARRVDRFVGELDLTSLRQAYAGRGSAAYPPELLLRLALFEIHRGRLSPAQWASDCRKDDAVKWLLFGLKPSRSCLYHFRDRVECHLDSWIRQILRIEQFHEAMSSGERWIRRSRVWIPV